MTNWKLDPDWEFVALSGPHAHHHIGMDRYGNYFCRECSTMEHGILTLRDDEVALSRLQERIINPSDMPF